MKKRVFLIVLDSLGVGRQADADLFGDKGSNTLAAISKSLEFQIPNLQKLGLLSIDGIAEDIKAVRMDDLTAFSDEKRSMPAKGIPVEGAYGRLAEISMGKDTTIGHWELAGIVSEKPLPVYPNGFPDEIIEEFEKKTGRQVLCNKPYSGTEVIKEYGEEHIRTGALIVYTSADSVFQIAAHEEIVPVQELYHHCEIARDLLCGDHAVGRVIARPFMGQFPSFERTKNRHDFSLLPPGDTILDVLSTFGQDVISIGKIVDIFAGRGVTEVIKTAGNADGIEKIMAVMKKDFQGLCFANLVDFDMLYGHRNDVDGYAAALRYFDEQLPDILSGLRADDILMITADHGCDPSTSSTDHSRENVPVLIYGQPVIPGKNLGVRVGFCDVAATIAEYLEVNASNLTGESFWKDIILD